MSKYGWDEETTESASVETPTNVVDERATPTIEIEEILNVPQEAINKDYKVLKETEAVEENLETLETAQESLKQIYKHIQETGKVSTETHRSLIEIAPKISLESANMYTTVPSTVQVVETEVAVRNEISFNEVLMAASRGRARLVAAQSLFAGKSSATMEDVANYVNEMIAQVGDGGYRHDQAINSVKGAIVDFAQTIQASIERAKSDLSLVGLSDANVKQAIESQLGALEGVYKTVTDEQALLAWFKDYLSPTAQTRLFGEELGEFVNIGKVLADYVTDRRVYNITETHEQKAHHRVCHQLDEINQWITDTANALLTNEEAPQETTYNGTTALEDYIGTNDDVEPFNIASAYQDTELKDYNPFLDVLNSSTSDISECMINNTHFLHRQFTRVANYINFYCDDLLPALDKYIRSRKYIMNNKEEAVLDSLYNNVQKLIDCLTLTLFKDVTVYVAKRNYFLGVMAGYQLTFNTLGDAVDSWIKHSEEYPDVVYEKANLIVEKAFRAVQIFSEPVMAIKA
jgi:hypothetical protein